MGDQGAQTVGGPLADGIEGGQHVIAEVVLAQVFPHVLDRIEFRTVRREEHETQVLRHAQRLRVMPPGAIQQHDVEAVGELLACRAQKDGHRWVIHPRQRQGAEPAIEGADGHDAVEVLAHDLGTHDRAVGVGCTAPPRVADASEARFVLKQQPPRTVPGPILQRFFEGFREFFLNAAWACGSARTWRGRGPGLRHT